MAHHERRHPNFTIQSTLQPPLLAPAAIPPSSNAFKSNDMTAIEELTSIIKQMKNGKQKEDKSKFKLDLKRTIRKIVLT